MTTEYTLGCSSKRIRLFFRTLYAAAVGLACGATYAQNVTVLKVCGSDGYSPFGTLVLSGNVLYGAAQSGGTGGYGTIFKVNTDGSAYTVLKNFDVAGPHSPLARLLLAGNTLYGSTLVDGTAGYGALIKINVDGTGYTVFKHFASTDGAGPKGGMVLSGSTLYGTTYNGGTWDLGLVFKINTDGTSFKVLREFTPYDGANPAGDLALVGSVLYGTTYNSGGTNGTGGTVFKMKTDGTGFTILKSFGYVDGNHPYAGLVVSGSTLYGAAYSAGANSMGTLYKVNTNGTGFALLHTFNGTDGANPYATLTLSGSTLYGTTYTGGGPLCAGTIFQLNNDGSAYTVLKSFLASEPAGTYLYAGATVSGTTLYGATCNGGAKYSGTIFSVAPGPAQPAITSQPQSRTNAVGTTATFEVTALPTNGLSYQWRKNSTDLVNGPLISGATSNLLTLTCVQSSDAGNYTVVLTNSSGALTSSVATLTVRRPPLALTDAFQIPLGLSLTIPIASLLANDYDPDGAAFGLSTVQSPSSLGANLTLANGLITYWGAFTGSLDHFTYSLTNVYGLSSSGTVNVTLTGTLPATNCLSMQPIAGGSSRFVFLGRLTFRYALDRTHSLASPVTWQPLETNWAGAGGYLFFTNTPSPGINNFYRVRYVNTFP